VYFLEPRQAAPDCGSLFHWQPALDTPVLTELGAGAAGDCFTDVDVGRDSDGVVWALVANEQVDARVCIVQLADGDPPLLPTATECDHLTVDPALPRVVKKDDGDGGGIVGMYVAPVGTDRETVTVDVDTLAFPYNVIIPSTTIDIAPAMTLDGTAATFTLESTADLHLQPVEPPDNHILAPTANTQETFVNLAFDAARCSDLVNVAFRSEPPPASCGASDVRVVSFQTIEERDHRRGRVRDARIFEPKRRRADCREVRTREQARRRGLSKRLVWITDVKRELRR